MSDKLARIINEVLRPPQQAVEPDPEARVPHYPLRRYAEQNLAPEQTLRYRDIAALARARRQAEETGVLSPELAEHLLPMAMTEGRSGNFGIVQEGAFYAKPKTLDRFKKMGLDPADQGAFAPVAFKDIPGKGRHIGPSGNAIGDSDAYARIMAAILADKAALGQPGDVEGAVMRYNGKGRAIEEFDGVRQQADVNVYLDKVKQAREMLAHPKNKQLLDYFNSIYQPR